MSLVGSLIFAFNFSSLASVVLIFEVDGSPVLEEVAAGHSSILELPSSMWLVGSLIFAFNFSSLASAVSS